MDAQHVAARAVEPRQDDHLVAGPDAVEALRHLGRSTSHASGAPSSPCLGADAAVGEGRFDPSRSGQVWLVHARQPRLAPWISSAPASSRRPCKQDERRLAIHPAHFERIDPAVRPRLFLERGYGERFGFSDDELEPLVGGLRSREELLAECDVIMLPKPLADDLETLRAGQVVWGWPHCVQDARMTQLAIERGLTLIAFEAMNHWTQEGNFSVHVFHKNNELAGYCSVLHALQLIGSTGDYGRRLRAAVISFGATARGAVRALSALGISDVTVLTQRAAVRRRLAVRVGADAPASPRRASRWRSCWPSTTSSSTASSRTPTTR